jgi:Ni,Fe-hydrogenase III small subunit
MKQPISAHVFNVLTGQNNSYNIELVDMTKENLYAIGVLILVMVSI